MDTAVTKRDVAIVLALLLLSILAYNLGLVPHHFGGCNPQGLPWLC